MSETIPAPTDADIGRVYLHGITVRVVLVNDRLVADQTIGEPDYQVVVKSVEPVLDAKGANYYYPVMSVDYRHLVATDEWIEAAK